MALDFAIIKVEGIGKELIFDLELNELNDLRLVEEESKVVQELIKYTLTKQGSDIFNPGLGSNIEDYIGNRLSMSYWNSRLKIAIIESILYLWNAQRIENELFNNISNNEMISNVVGIEIEKLGIMGIRAKVKVETVVGRVISTELLFFGVA